MADHEANRTRFILRHQLTAAIISLNACYCTEDGEEELSNRPGFIVGLAEDLAGNCSHMQLEDAIEVLSLAIKKKGPRQSPQQPVTIV